MTKRKISKSGYLALGIVCAIVALIFIPPVFGIVSIFAGVQLFRKYDEGLGLAIVITGAVCLVLGMILGMLAVS